MPMAPHNCVVQGSLRSLAQRHYYQASQRSILLCFHRAAALPYSLPILQISAPRISVLEGR